MEYNYDKFLNDSSDDYPKYEDAIEYKQSDDDWVYRDAYDHIEERERDAMLAQDEQLAEEDFLSDFQEVIRLAKTAIQPWWTEEYRAKSENKINTIEEYFNKLKK